MNTTIKQPDFPVPPNLKSGDHHWLEKYDSDGHSGGLVVLQWNPGAKLWSHSGNMGTGIYVDVQGWKYITLCPLPVEMNSGEYEVANKEPELKQQTDWLNWYRDKQEYGVNAALEAYQLRLKVDKII